jgi:predicted phosphodiesterase
VSAQERISNIRARVLASLVAAVLVGVAGAWLGTRLFGQATVEMGPFLVRLDASFGRGVTEIVLPPVGHLTADTHLAPIQLRATLSDVRINELTRDFGTRPTEDLLRAVELDAIGQLVPFAIRTLLATMLGAGALSLLVYRSRLRQVEISMLAALVLVLGSGTAMWATYDPAAFERPSFSGTIALAPELIGPARQATQRIDAFRDYLRGVVGSAVEVFTGFPAQGLSTPDQITILHISDIHLLPLGMDFAAQLARSFDVDFVVDTGDLTSFGTPVDEFILAAIPGFGRPYVFVQGNHDSDSLVAAMQRLSNVTVLDGTEATLDGVTIFGRGMPASTRVGGLTPEEFADRSLAAGEQVADEVAALDEPPDIVAVHDDRMAEQIAGTVPLVISGHYHSFAQRVEKNTVYLRVGSTGGTGETVFTEPGGFPLSAELLIFDRGDPPKLVAFDLIAQSPESGSISLTRHLVSDLLEEAVTPTPSQSSASADTGPST